MKWTPLYDEFSHKIIYGIKCSSFLTKLLIYIFPILLTFQAYSQSLSQLKKQYKEAGYTESIETGLQILTSLEEKHGINDNRYHTFFFSYMHSLSNAYYQGNLAKDKLNVMDSLGMRFLSHRERTDAVIKVNHKYGNFDYDENGGRFNDALHILCDIYGNTNTLQLAKDDIDPVIIKKFANYYLNLRGEAIGQGDPRLLAEMVIVLDNYEKIKNYLWNENLDSEINELQTQISHFTLTSEFSNYEIVPEMSYLPAYLIRNEHFALANELIKLFTKGYKNTPVSTKKETHPFFEDEYNYVHEGSYNSNNLRNDYRLIFDHLLSVNLNSEAKRYAEILKAYANLNIHYPNVKHLYQSNNYEELVRYFEAEVVNRKNTITDLTPPEWKYLPGLQPDDLPLYPMIVEAYYKTDDIDKAIDLFKEWFFYVNTLYEEKIDLKTVKVHKQLAMTVTFTSRPVSTFSSYVNPIMIGKKLSRPVARKQIFGRNAFMIQDLIDEKTKKEEIEFANFLERLLEESYKEYAAISLLLPEE